MKILTIIHGITHKLSTETPMNLTQKPIISGSLFSTALFTAAFALTATAGTHREGMYVGMELGIAEQDNVTLNGHDNDVPTRCDQVLRDRKADEIAQDPANNAWVMTT